MIICKTPLRLSFLGGGTDLPIFINKNGYGCVISSTINKYIYITIKEHGELFSENIRLNYSNTETVSKISMVRNDIIRETLKFLKIKKKIYISTISDIPAKSGLGSSSTFCVGLLQALYNFKGIKVGKDKIAKEAFYIEKDILGRNIGYQDHYIAAYGGLNFIKFYKNKIDIKKISNKNIHKKLFDYNLCFCLNKFRNADSILKDQVANFNENNQNLIKIKNLTLMGYKDLLKKDFKKFFIKVDKSWKEKRSLSKKISNKKIDLLYNESIKLGVLGGKISGAGGGGFLNLFAKKESHKKIIENFRKLNYQNIDINFEPDGSKCFIVK